MRLEEIFIGIAKIGVKISVQDSFNKIIEMNKKLIHQSLSEKCTYSLHVTLGQEMLKVADMRTYL